MTAFTTCSRHLRDNWRYFPSIRRIGIGQSRDRNADTYKIKRAAEALRAAGYQVTVSVDESARRTVAEIETDRAERAEARAERYEERSERTSAQASADYARARQMAEAIPFGQPMMPDHYSYGRDRRYRDRIHNTFGRAFAGMDEAKELERRAESAEATQAHRESVPATLRRIAKLEADARRVQRGIDGRLDYVSDGNGDYKLTLVKPGPRYLAQLEARARDIAEQLDYWREHVKAAEDQGAKVWTRADFTKGDYVQFLGGWYAVLRVSAKSVTIPAMINDGPVVHAAGNRCTWTDTVPYHKVKGRKSADEMTAMLAEADKRESVTA